MGTEASCVPMIDVSGVSVWGSAPQPQGAHPS